jgi:hypothetical protein
LSITPDDDAVHSTEQVKRLYECVHFEIRSASYLKVIGGDLQGIFFQSVSNISSFVINIAIIFKHGAFTDDVAVRFYLDMNIYA